LRELRDEHVLLKIVLFQYIALIFRPLLVFIKFRRASTLRRQVVYIRKRVNRGTIIALSPLRGFNAATFGGAECGFIGDYKIIIIEVVRFGVNRRHCEYQAYVKALHHSSP
jgi:hypothetical protein